MFLNSLWLGKGFWENLEWNDTLHSWRLKTLIVEDEQIKHFVQFDLKLHLKFITNSTHHGQTNERNITPYNMLHISWWGYIEIVKSLTTPHHFFKIKNFQLFYLLIFFWEKSIGACETIFLWLSLRAF